jgi:hypothetical protein
MKFARIALIAASVGMTACASDGTTGPTDTRAIESRLAAVASTPDGSGSLATPGVTVRVTVTSSLTETVSGGVCAESVEARLASDTRWSDVTSSTAVCSALAIQIRPGATVTIDGIADPAKIRSMAAPGTSVMLRVRHSLAGSEKSYVLQSNEVAWVVL